MRNGGRLFQKCFGRMHVREGNIIMPVLVGVKPCCMNCFWLKVDWEKGYFCEHPQYETKIPLDEVDQKTQCDGEGWVYNHKDVDF